MPVDLLPRFKQSDSMRSRVRFFMDKMGVTLTALERTTGLTRGTILRAAKDGDEGIGSISVKNLEKIADVFGLHPRDLMGEKD